MNCAYGAIRLFAALLSLALSSNACDSASSSSQGTGGVGAHSSGGASSMNGASGGVASGGLNGTGSTGGATLSAAGGAPYDAGVICSRNFDWMDPKCGGFASPCGSEPCSACTIAECASALVETFGAGWANGTPTGPCASVLDCIRQCDCEDIDCYGSCPFPRLNDDASATTPCEQAAIDLAACDSTTCRGKCITSGG